MDNIDYQQLQNSQNLDTELYKCPSCGANVEFDPTTQSLKCMHCGTVVSTFKNTNVREREFSEAANSTSWNDETRVFRCANCGAKEILPRLDIAVECPYCKSTNIVNIDEMSGIKPDTVLPFGFSADNATPPLQKMGKKALVCS